MENTKQFTEQELAYINIDVFDKTQSIYAYCSHKTIKGFPAKYKIYCNEMPKGHYRLEGKNIDFDTTTVWRIGYGFEPNLKPYYDTSKKYGFDFIINAPCSFGLTITCKDVENYVKELRKQAILNGICLKPKTERLIEKTIQKRENISIKRAGQKTDLGKAYNERSLYETAQECLDEDITIALDESKPTSDLFVRYLHAMKLKQDMQRLEKKQQSLDKEKSDIKRRKNELFGK